jgi:hypothetical protein
MEIPRMTARLSLFLFLVLWAPAVALGQSVGTLGALEATHRMDTSAMSTASVTVSGTYSGTVSFEVIGAPGTAAVTVDCATPAAPGSAINSTTGSGVWVCPVAGMSALQARMSAYASGAAVVGMLAADSPGQTVAAAGGGGSFDGVLLDAAGGDSLADTANNALRVNIVAGAGSGGTAIADDAAFTVATTSVTPAGALFDDVTPDSVNENDAGAVRMSGNRNLYTTIRDAAGNERGLNIAADGSIAVTSAAGATAANQSTMVTALQLIDNIPITIGSTTSGQSGALAMGAVSTSAPTYTNAQSHPLSLDTSGALRVAITSGAGSGGTAIADRAAFTSGTTSFTPVGGFYQATVTQVTDGQAAAAGLTIGRALKVAISNPDGSAATYATDVVEDAAETAGGGGPMVLSVRRDTAASSAGTAGDNATFNTDSLGRLWVRPGVPCSDHARIESVAIDTSTSGNVQLVALNGSDLIYVCGYSVMVGATATAVQFIRGTGTACGTGETDLTGPWPFAANGGITQANAGVPQFIVPAGNALCIELSAANPVAGHVTFVRTSQP